MSIWANLAPHQTLINHLVNFVCSVCGTCSACMVLPSIQIFSQFYSSLCWATMMNNRWYLNMVMLSSWRGVIYFADGLRWDYCMFDHQVRALVLFVCSSVILGLGNSTFCLLWLIPTIWLIGVICQSVLAECAVCMGIFFKLIIIYFLLYIWTFHTNIYIHIKKRIKKEMGFFNALILSKSEVYN